MMQVEYWVNGTVYLSGTYNEEYALEIFRGFFSDEECGLTIWF
jgi:hypothetical protein